jgi:hypothetical protein
MDPGGSEHVPANNTRVTIRLSPVISNQEPYRYLELRIIDAVSGLEIVHVQLHAQDALDLLSNSQVGDLDGIEAWVIDRPLRDKLGFVHVHVSRDFPSFPPEGWEADGDRYATWKAALKNWADETAVAIGCDSATCSPRNTGRTTVTVRSYLPPDTDTESWRRTKGEILAALPGPAGGG